MGTPRSGRGEREGYMPMSDIEDVAAEAHESMKVLRDLREVLDLIRAELAEANALKRVQLRHAGAISRKPGEAVR